MAQQIRLEKYLADLGFGTRTKIKADIKKGKVTVNGEAAEKPELKINIQKDKVMYLHKEVAYAGFEYYMFHKPQGCVSATNDNVHETVIDYIDGKRNDLFPVGRLDIDTEGFLLITNDGNLAHRLLSPKKHVAKTYYAKIRGRVTNSDIIKFKKGIDIGENANTLPAKLVILKSDTISEIEVTLTEGKFHQIKRMFEVVGKEVLYLKRISMGGLKLDETLKPGEYREISDTEMKQLEEKVQSYE